VRKSWVTEKDLMDIRDIKADADDRGLG